MIQNSEALIAILNRAMGGKRSTRSVGKSYGPTPPLRGGLP